MVLYALGIIKKADTLLLLLRKNTQWFSGYYGLVGGKIESNESVASGLIREMYEEIGIIVAKDTMHFSHCLSFKNEHGTDHIALVFAIDDWQGELANQELDKQKELAWFPLHNLPENVIPRHRQIIEMVRRNELYSEDGW